MSSELQTLNERIAERVGSELVDLMPEGEWHKIVDAQLHKFKNEVAPKIVMELITEEYKNVAKSFIDDITSSRQWKEESQAYVSEELQKFIGASSGVIISGMLSPVMTEVLTDLRHRLGY